MSFETVFLVIVLQLCPCDAIIETIASRLLSYDGLACPQTDILFLQTDVRSRIECVTRCTELSHCACIFYKQGFCQGCQGLCHHGHYGTPLPALAETTYYYLNKEPGISTAPGVFTFDSNYYLASTFKATWDLAQNYCNSLQATLVNVENTAEFEFLAAELGPHFYWSGGILSGNQYVWSHSGASVTMSLFAPGQPDNYRQCVGLWDDDSYRLHDTFCNQTEHFICKSF